MDEPTAVLAPQEADDLFATLRSMTARRPERRLHQPQARRGPRDRRPDHGHAPRPGHGRRACRRRARRRRDLARLMVGRTVLELLEQTPFAPGDVVLLASTDVEADERPRAAGAPRRVARRPGRRDRRHRGGRRQRPERARRGRSPACARCTRRRSASAARPSRNRPPRDAIIGRGVAHVPEDRTGVGSAPNLSLTDNLIMKRYRDAPVARGWLIDDGAARGRSPTELKEAYRDRRAHRSTREVRLLSGGNLQRLILAREIETAARAADRRPADARPRRRGDRDASTGCSSSGATSGAAILLISEELDEILALADRVDVMYEGRIVGSFDAATADVARDRPADDRRRGRRGRRGRGRPGRRRRPRAGGRPTRVEPDPDPTRRDDPPRAPPQRRRWLSPAATILAARRRARHQRRRSSRSSAATRSGPTATSSTPRSAASASSPTRSSRRRR